MDDKEEKMKKKIRLEMISIRNKQPLEEISEKSKKIIQNIRSLQQFKETKIINCYISKFPEVPTHDFIKEILKSGKFLTVPYIDNEIGNLKISLLHDFNELEPSSFNILEPKQKVLISKEKIDLFLTPGVAFDRNCNRMGYGRGFYDNFLRDVEGLKIGLAFDFQIIKSVPIEEHDVKMDMVITEKEIITKKK